MWKSQIKYLILASLLSSCNLNNKSLKIDYKVIENSKNYIVDSLDQSSYFCGYNQLSDCKVKYFKDDEIVFNTFDSIDLNTIIELKSRWNYIGDTLQIKGVIGSRDYTKSGFRLNYIDDSNYYLWLNEKGHLIPLHSATAEGDLEFDLFVETDKFKVILSEIPSKNDTLKFIYGYIELKSKNYYQSEKYYPDTGEEMIESRIKLSQERSFYFKSKYCE